MSSHKHESKTAEDDATQVCVCVIHLKHMDQKWVNDEMSSLKPLWYWPPTLYLCCVC